MWRFLVPIHRSSCYYIPRHSRYQRLKGGPIPCFSIEYQRRYCRFLLLFLYLVGRLQLRFFLSHIVSVSAISFRLPFLFPKYVLSRDFPRFSLCGMYVTFRRFFLRYPYYLRRCRAYIGFWRLKESITYVFGCEP